MASRHESSQDLLAYADARIASHVPAGARICVGYSGGLDSTVLLELLARMRERRAFALSAIHVHHGLSPNADGWAAHCEARAQGLGVPFAIERVQVDRASPSGIEAAARAARYAAYARTGAPFVALAHHLDDQAETVLLQLLRGSGLKGLAAMAEHLPLPGTDAMLLRPLLDVPRETLREYAKLNGLRWVDDESNESLDIDRNALRMAIVPPLAERFPAWRVTLARSARHAASAERLLAQLAKADLGEAFSGKQLASLDADRQANALRFFLGAQGLAMPSEARLADMARQLGGARNDAQVRIEHDGRWIVRHRGTISVVEATPAEPAWRHEWRGERELSLGAPRGRVHFSERRGEGIAGTAVLRGQWHFATRAGGERMRLDAGRPTRTLKNLLQERGVPAWQRPAMPLLFHDDELVWVPLVGVAADHLCPPSEDGLLPVWSPGT
jgi:tRNA(Ile)-lysidine synthase